MNRLVMVSSGKHNYTSNYGFSEIILIIPTARVHETLSFFFETKLTSTACLQTFVRLASCPRLVADKY